MALLATASAPAVAATPEEAAAAAKPRACADVTTEWVGLPNVRIVSAVAAPAANGEPEACVVSGAANERVGADGSHYALGFELRLPQPWNGRFLHQVNGGNDGEIVPATGDPKNMNAVAGKSALARGFAVLSGNEGHSGADPAFAAFGLGAGSAFGLDPQARSDYGYSGDTTLGPIAKADHRALLRRRPGPLLHVRLLEWRAARDGRRLAHGRILRRLRRRRSRL